MSITIGLKIAEEGKIFFCNACNRYVRKQHLLNLTKTFVSRDIS